MALVQLSCPLCGGWFQIDDAYAGMQVACPHCQNSVLIPAQLSAGTPGEEVVGMAAPAEEEVGWSPGIDFPAIDLPPELPGESASVEFPDGPPASGVDFPPELLPPDPLPESPPADTKPVKPAPVPVRPAPAASASQTAAPARAPKKAPRPVVRKPAGNVQSDAPQPAVKRETSERRPTPATKAPEAKSSGVKTPAAKTPAAKPTAKASEVARASAATSGDSKPSSKSGEVQAPGKGSEVKPAVKRPPQSPRSKAASASSTGASPAVKPSATVKPPVPKKVAAAAEQSSREAATTSAPAVAATPQRPELRKAPRAELLLPLPAAPAANGAARTYPQPHAPIPLPEFDESALPENPDQARFDKLFDPEQAAILKLKEPTAKIIQADGEEIQLRKLTPEERAARRLKYNIIFVAATALILAIILIVSLKF